MDIVTLDFETYYDKEYSLKKVPTEAYIRDSRFQVIGVGVRVNDDEPVWYSGSKWRKFLGGIDFANSALLAHNTMFDAAILFWRGGFRPKVLLDTLSMAKAIHGPDQSVSLAALAKLYGLQNKGVEVHNAIGKRRDDFSADELSAYGDYCVTDVMLTHQLFHIMCREFPPKELKLIDSTLRMFVEPRLVLDTGGLRAHLNNVRHAKQDLLNALDPKHQPNTHAAMAFRVIFPDGIDKKDLMSNPKFAGLLESLGATVPKKVSRTTGKETYAFAKTDKAFVDMVEHENPAVAALVSARLGTKSTIEETRTAGLLEASVRGNMPVQLSYYGAKTGRWSGAGGLNFQNLPKKSPLMSMIRAPDGYSIISADLSNIELRVGLWLAGEHARLNALRDGLDLYKDFAAGVFGVEYAAVDKTQRFIGKTSQLSLIYGVGAGKLNDALVMGAKNMLNTTLDISGPECEAIVAKYRNDYAGVVYCWEQGRQAIHSVYRNQYQEIFYDGFAKVDGSKGLRLPSGLYMQYANLRQHENNGYREWIYDIRRGVDKLYGGKVFQQYTQGTARCVIAEAILRVRSKLKLVLTVHDSLYALVKQGTERDSLAFMLEAMVETPSWIPGLPLDAEGGWGRTLKDAGRELMKTKQGNIVEVT